MDDLKKIGQQEKYAILDLATEQKIKTFFTFIGGSIDPIEVVTRLKNPECPSDPCEQIVIEGVKDRMTDLCEVLNLQKSGLPPIPINKILKAIGLDQLFNKGIQSQFKQLKTEQLLYLGFPSEVQYPTVASINEFLPEEKYSLLDYDLLNKNDKINTEIFNKNVFRNYYLRGGSTLKWKYDEPNLNQKLVGSTLEDICGDGESFEETFVHIFNDVFKEDLNSILEVSSKQKEDYKNIKPKEGYKGPNPFKKKQIIN